jgi:hypothetical protein
MRGYAFIAFAGFAGCCLAQFWFLHRIKIALIERHPDTFLAIEKSSFFPYQGLSRFVRKKRYKDLNDPELDKRVRDFKRLFALALVCWLAYGVSLFTDPVFQH